MGRCLIPCGQGTLSTYRIQQKKFNVLYICQRFKAFLARSAMKGRAVVRENRFQGCPVVSRPTARQSPPGGEITQVRGGSGDPPREVAL